MFIKVVVVMIIIMIIIIISLFNKVAKSICIKLVIPKAFIWKNNKNHRQSNTVTRTNVPP